MSHQPNLKKEINLRAPGLNRGFFIVIEGLDGAGKSTQAALLAEALKAGGYEGDKAPELLKEPTDGPYGRQIRALARAGRQGLSPEEELDLFLKDRAEDVAQNIAPALLAGRPVICDRYILSNIAYQSALGLDEKYIRDRNQAFPWPDLTVILETPVETGLARIARSRAEGADAAFERPDFLGRVKKSFDRQNFPGLLRLNGQLPPAEITALIMAELKRLGLAPKPDLRIVDSHCHLCSKAFGDLPQTLARARAAGVGDIINIGLGPENSRQVLALAEAEPWCRPVVGWHPHEADELTSQGLREIAALAADPKVLAFGEIGLDYALMHSAKDRQLSAFEELLDVAVSLDLPVVIHSREAFDDTYRILKKYAPRLKRGGLIHCFTRGWNEAAAYLDLGFYLSIPGVITYPKNDELRQAAAQVPADRLMIETDAPYLSPVPFRGQRNESSYLVYHLMTLAEIRKTTVPELAAQTSANAGTFFRF